METNSIKFSLLLFTAALALASAVNNATSHEIDVAITEMTRANYFTFVTLLNLFPLDERISGNVTFLMPNDKILSKSRIFENSISDFLLHHSIPSPLLFDHLQRIPSGSSIPSSDPDFMLDINNNGRKNFTINNVRIISINICTAGSSIRCHGIDGVIAPSKRNTLSSCPPVVSAFPPVFPSADSPVNDGHDQIIIGAPQPMQDVGENKPSGSHQMSLKLVIIYVSVLILCIDII